MRVDVIVNDGSPLGVTEQDMMGVGTRNGVGGAEQSLLTLCRGWFERGYDITLYNNPTVINGSVFPQKNLSEFDPKEDRDILIVFRSPNERIVKAKGKKIWWSTDQFTVGNFREFASRVDKIICISPTHAKYFKDIYGIFNTKVIDLPVRTWEYTGTTPKIKNSCIFTSVPDRGLRQLLPIWDKIIEQVPDATLTITSDWSLWTGGDVSHHVSPYRMAWAGKKNVRYVGAVKREELVKIQESAEFHLYPCIYEELFCISASESQVAGAIPITSKTGALATTNRFGYQIEGVPTSREFIDRFVDKTVELMTSDDFSDIRTRASNEFGLEHILDIWDEVFSD